MFLNNIFQFWKGYVILYLNGFYMERFINICMRRCIRLWGIARTGKTNGIVCMSIGDFRNIRPVAYKTKTAVRIKKKCGLPILLHRYRRRYVLAAGLAALVAFIAVMSQFIWSIDVVGADHSDPAQIMAAAEKAGVRIGVFKGALKSGQEMKDIILNNTTDISWAWVYIKGTKAVVEVKESILPPAVIDKSQPCDVVAARDALIRKVTVKNGKSAVQPGDAVLAGDVIIAGTLEFENSPYKLVHAMGTAEASTWHEKTGEYKLYYETRVPTGNQKTYHTLRLFSKNVHLFFKNRIPYAEYDTIENSRELQLGKDRFLGIGLDSVTYKEMETHREPISYETAVELARRDLEEQIAKELLPGADKVAEHIKDEKIDDETIRVTLTMEFVEQIGVENPITAPPPEPEKEQTME